MSRVCHAPLTLSILAIDELQDEQGFAVPNDILNRPKIGPDALYAPLELRILSDLSSL